VPSAPARTRTLDPLIKSQHSTNENTTRNISAQPGATLNDDLDVVFPSDHDPTFLEFVAESGAFFRRATPAEINRVFELMRAPSASPRFTIPATTKGK
jgi:hypothetical protein